MIGQKIRHGGPASADPQAGAPKLVPPYISPLPCPIPTSPTSRCSSPRPAVATPLAGSNSLRAAAATWKSSPAQVETWLRAKVDASDLVQETMLEAFRDFERFGGQNEQEWLAWLKRILAHNAADFVRRYRGTAKRQARREVPIRSPHDSTQAFGVAEPAAPSPRPARNSSRSTTSFASRRPWPSCPPITRRSSSCGTSSGCRSTRWPSGWVVPAPPCRCSGCGRSRSCKRRWGRKEVDRL